MKTYSEKQTVDTGIHIDEVVDDIERITNNNEMLENVICTLMNVSQDLLMHYELINNGFIEVVKKYIDLFFSISRVEPELGVNEAIDGI